MPRPAVMAFRRQRLLQTLPTDRLSLSPRPSRVHRNSRDKMPLVSLGLAVLAIGTCSISTVDAFTCPALTRATSRPIVSGRTNAIQAFDVSDYVGMRLSARTWAAGAAVESTSGPCFQLSRKRARVGSLAGSGSVSMSSSLETGLGELFKVPDERILKAVEKAGNRAVPSDVAALAGVDISVAKKGLVSLANMVGGDLEVSREGDVVYNFPSNFRASLLQQSAYRRVVEALRGAWPVIFYGIRVSFGVVLLASIALIFSTIFFAATYASSAGGNDRDDRRRGGDPFRGGGGPMGFNAYFGPSPFDFFYYRPYYGYYNTPVRQRGDPEEMGFLESIFSYIFGDGDPNSDIEQRRVEAAAKLIRDNGGAISAEQLAPLLSPGEPRPNDSRVDESFVLPILTALEGSPEVTPDGDIVYVFPTLQTSAIDGAVASVSREERERDERLQGLRALSTADLRFSLQAVGIRAQAIFERSDLVDAALKAGIKKLPDGRIVLEPLTSARSPPAARTAGTAGANGVIIPAPLEEAERPFSVAAQWKKVAAGVLGAVNLGGAVYLQGILSGPAFSGVTLPGYYGFVQGAMPFLLTYAVALNAIPAVRWVLNKRANAQIEQRNQHRRQWAAMAKSGSNTVDRKLKAAKSMTKELKVIKADDVAYTTGKSLLDQNVNPDEDAMDDFDARLRSKERAAGGAGEDVEGPQTST